MLSWISGFCWHLTDMNQYHVPILVANIAYVYIYLSVLFLLYLKDLPRMTIFKNVLNIMFFWGFFSSTYSSI